MPIHGLSERRRLPRLGKIRLGVTVQEPGRKPYPKATSYFVVPPEVAAVHGDQPTALPIMFPSDDLDAIFPQSLKLYRTAGLFCSGDGRTAKRWDDKGQLKEIACPCPYLESGECGPSATLSFFLPNVPGIGVWQIQTGNKTSIVGLNSALELYARMFGGLRGVPFTLLLEPQQTERWDEKKGQMVKTTIYCLRLTTERTLLEVLDWRKQLGASVDRLMLPVAEPEDAKPPVDREGSDGDTPHETDSKPNGHALSQSGTDEVPSKPGDEPGRGAPALTGESVAEQVLGPQTQPRPVRQEQDDGEVPTEAGQAALFGEEPEQEMTIEECIKAMTEPPLGVMIGVYRRYLANKYGDVDNMDAEDLAEQATAIRKAREDPDYRVKFLGHVEKVAAKR